MEEDFSLFYARSLTLDPHSLLQNRTETRATQAKLKLKIKLKL